MLRIPAKPFTENQLQYYSYINYNFVNDYLIGEDSLLESIDADLPTAHELLEQRKTYNKTAKRIDQEIKKMKRKFGKVTTNEKFVLTLNEVNDRYYLIDADGSIIEWDRDTYEHFKDKKGFNYVS
jgi:ribonucleotide reductase alpha subunit